MPRIAISYRRDDSGVITGRIFDRLAAHYGREAVFRDIDSIPPGADFRAHINHVLEDCDMVLAVVGPRWVGQRGGQSRLSDDADPVRVEIEAALRKDVPLIPVLVLKAGMPRVEQLPGALQDFAYRNSVSVDAGQDFDLHMSRLITAMDRILAEHGAPPGVQPDGAAKIPGEAGQPGQSGSQPDLSAAPRAAAAAQPGPAPAPRRLAYGLGAGLIGVVLGVGATIAADRYLWESHQSAALSREVKALSAKEVAETRLKDTRNALTAQIDQLKAQLKTAHEQLAAALAGTASPGEAQPSIPERIRQVQHALRVIGYFQGIVNGVPGPDLRAAVEKFQSFQGTPQTGRLSPIERRNVLDMAEWLGALLDRPLLSPEGTPALAVRGGAQRYAKAYGFDKGEGVQQDPDEAAYWYALAAIAGNAKALTSLGTLLLHGHGAEKPDPGGAAVLWQAAAARGEAPAMFNLALLYEKGVGVAPDRAKAQAWLERAAALNDPQARAALNRP